MRGSSAPMLFKSRSRAHRLQRSHEDTIQTDDDSYSTHLQPNRTNDEFPLVICCFFSFGNAKKKIFFSIIAYRNNQMAAKFPKKKFFP